MEWEELEGALVPGDLAAVQEEREGAEVDREVPELDSGNRVAVAPGVAREDLELAAPEVGPVVERAAPGLAAPEVGLVVERAGAVGRWAPPLRAVPANPESG